MPQAAIGGSRTEEVAHDVVPGLAIRPHRACLTEMSAQ
jgi:hypothetical protein